MRTARLTLPHSASPHRAVVSDPWWLHPGSLLALMLGTSTLSAYVIPASAYAELWKVPKLVGLEHVVAMAVVIFAFVGGCIASLALWNFRQREITAAQTPNGLPSALNGRPILFELFWVSLVLTLIGYAVWFSVAYQRGLGPNTIVALLSGESGIATDVKHGAMQTIPGLTTMTQFGLATVVLGVCCLRVRPSRSVMVALVTLLPLSLVRALLNSERLAVVELIAPAIVLGVGLFVVGRRGRASWLGRVVAAAPILLIASVSVFFGALEYFRSWSNHYASDGGSVVVFTLTRLSGYYATAVNNGVLLYGSATLWPDLPVFTLAPLLKLTAIVDPSLGDSEAFESFTADLAQYGNPEFNSPCGPALLLHDFGFVLFPVVVFVAGFLCGAIYRSYLVRGIAGLLLYPLIVVALAESPRILYLSMSRATPSLVLLLVSGPLIRRFPSLAGQRHSGRYLRPRRGKAALS